MSAPIDERWIGRARELIVAKCVHDGARANQCVECVARALAAEREAALEEAVAVAKAHIGSAAKKRGPMSGYDESTREEIRAEERGEGDN